MASAASAQYLVAGPAANLRQAAADLRAVPGVSEVREHTNGTGQLEFLTVALDARLAPPQGDQLRQRVEQRLAPAGLSLEEDRPLRPM